LLEVTAKRSPALDPEAAAARRRQRRIQLVLALFSLAFGIVLAEVAVRLVAPQTALAGLDFLVADPEIGWRLQPHVDRRLSNQREFRVRVRTDERGLRVESDAPSAPPALLALGDSYVFGWGVEARETFVARLGERLAVPVANAGVPGYGPCQAAGLGEALLDPLRPRGVLLALFLGNDEINAASGIGTWEIHDGGLVAPGWRPSPLRALTHPIFQSSHLLRMLRFSAPARWVERRWFGKPNDLAAALEEILQAVMPAPPETVVRGDEAIARCVPRLRDALAAGGTRLGVALLPDWTQVDPARLAADAAVIGASGLDPAAPARRLAALFAAAGIETVDLRPALAAAVARGETIYFEVDRHFTPLGHLRAAEALEASVRGMLAPRAEPASNP
jgi:hypothetical protein